MDNSTELRHGIPISGCRGDHSLGVLDLARMRGQARELRTAARWLSSEAWLLERAIDGALALAILDAAPRHRLPL